MAKVKKIFSQHWRKLLILFLAVAVRFWQFGQMPSSLYWEETAIAYDALSIAQTGRDYHNHPWPLVAFESFGDYKPSGYFYATAVLFEIFGAHDWVVRLPSFLAGIVLVFLLGALVEKMFPDRKVGSWRVSEIAMAVTAFNPALIHLSRVGFESNLATTFLVAGILLLYPDDKHRLRWRAIWGEISLIASFYTYHSLRVIAPLIGLYLLIWQWPKTKAAMKKDGPILLTMAIVALICLSPFIISLGSQQTTQRFSETSIFSDNSIIEEINQCRQIAHDSFGSRFWCHRYLFWAREILQNYFSHFRLDYLFLTGDNNPRHSIQFGGIFWPWEVIALWWAIMYVTKNWSREKNQLMFLLFWLAVAIVPASLTHATPHLLRTLTGVPVMLIFITLGWSKLFVLCQKYRSFLQIFFGCVYLLGLIIWSDVYFHNYDINWSDQWQSGYEQAMAQLQNLQKQYPDLPVYITRSLGRPSVYYFWYQKVSPASVQAVAESELMDQGEYLTFSPDKVTFGTGFVDQEQLFVVMPAEFASIASSEATSEVHNAAGETVLIVGKQNL